MKNRGIDAGGSTVRVARTENQIMTIPAACAEIPYDAPSKEHILSNDKDKDFVIKTCGMPEISGRRFVRGVAVNQYHGRPMVCDNTSIKVKQDITYINILYGLALDCLQSGTNDERFRIAACIPAAEYYDDENDRVHELKNKLQGSTEIYFPMLDESIRFDLDVDNILVAAEGVVAARKYRTNRDFVKKNVAIVDCGYRSTDITILLNFSPVGASAASRPIGGINLEANVLAHLERDNILIDDGAVQSALSNTYLLRNNTLLDITEYLDGNRGDLEGVAMLLAEDDISVTVEEIKNAMRKYYITNKGAVVDITEYVTKAKEVFAEQVYKSIVSVVNSKMMYMSDLSGVLCVGRPFNGDTEDENNLVNILNRKFTEGIIMYTVPDSGTANVVELITAIGPDTE